MRLYLLGVWLRPLLFFPQLFFTLLLLLLLLLLLTMMSAMPPLIRLQLPRCRHRMR